MTFQLKTTCFIFSNSWSLQNQRQWSVLKGRLQQRRLLLHWGNESKLHGRRPKGETVQQQSICKLSFRWGYLYLESKEILPTFWLVNHWCWIFLTCFGMVRQRLVSFHWSYLLWICFAAFAVSDFLFVCIFNVHRKLHLLTGRCQKRHGHSTIINQTNNSRWFQRFINLLVSKKQTGLNYASTCTYDVGKAS